MYVAWYVNKQLVDVCSMICKQTISGCMCMQTIMDVCKQTISGCM